MGHLFISYSHRDAVYVHKLREKLIAEGFEAWIDDRIDYGDEWPIVIQERLDSCDAFILVATEDSFKSRWVQKEVTRAQRINKPFFPLLLSGNPWLSIESTQYADVRDKSLPPEKFYRRLARVSPRKKASDLPNGRKQILVPKNLPKPRPSPQKTDLQKVQTGVLTKSEVEHINTITVKEQKKSTYLQNITAVAKSIINKFQKASRRVKVISAIVASLFILFLMVKASTWQAASAVSKQTALAQASLQQSTISVALTQTFQAFSFALTNQTRTNTPIIARATITHTPTSNPATKTVGAAFTLLARSTLTVIPTSSPNPATQTVGAAFTEVARATRMIIPTPTATYFLAYSPNTTLVPSNATLLLDKNYICREGPGIDYPVVVSLAKGIRLPVYGKNEQGNWWLVQIQFSNFQTGYCWVNGGSIEGNVATIQVISPLP